MSEVSSRPDGNGNWTPVEQRAKTVTERKDSARSEQEQVYRPDTNGKLVLSERDLRSYQKDASGREYWTTETYGGKITGFYPMEGLQLERKVTVVREKLPDGSERTTQRVAERNIQDRPAGLKPAQETVTTSKPAGGGMTDVVIEVREADVNGNMKTVATQKMRVSDR